MSRVSGRPYFVYVLWSAGGRCFYTGISEDPGKRLLQHNESGRSWTEYDREEFLLRGRGRDVVHRILLLEPRPRSDRRRS